MKRGRDRRDRQEDRGRPKQEGGKRVRDRKGGRESWRRDRERDTVGLAKQTGRRERETDMQTDGQAETR